MGTMALTSMLLGAALAARQRAQVVLERVQLAEGHLQIVSAAAQGTTVQVRLPLASPLPSALATAPAQPLAAQPVGPAHAVMR